MTLRHKLALDYAMQVLKSAEYKDIVHRVYLFGSCARGEERYHSDVDLLVIVIPDAEESVLRKLKTEVISDQRALPEVNIVFVRDSRYGSISVLAHFDKNIRRDHILL